MQIPQLHRTTRRSAGSILAPLLLVAACSTPPRQPEAPGNLDTFRAIAHPTPNAQRNGAGRPGAGYWQQQVDYQIEATLDPSQHRITATADVLYHNNSPDPLPSRTWLGSAAGSTIRTRYQPLAATNGSEWTPPTSPT